MVTSLIHLAVTLIPGHDNVRVDSDVGGGAPNGYMTSELRQASWHAPSMKNSALEKRSDVPDFGYPPA